MANPSRRYMKPFGWGEQNVTFNVEADSPAHKFLQNKLGVTTLNPHPSPLSLNKVKIVPSKLPNKVLTALQDIVSAENLAVDEETRKQFCGGRSYRDLINMRSLELKAAPDAVVYPTNKEQIQQILKLCVEQRVAIVPYGGGTSVVGGLDPSIGKHKYCICIDLTKCNRILSIDKDSHY